MTIVQFFDIDQEFKDDLHFFLQILTLI